MTLFLSRQARLVDRHDAEARRGVHGDRGSLVSVQEIVEGRMDVQDTGFSGLEGAVLRLLPAGVSDRGRNGEMHAIEVVTSAALRAVSLGVDRDDRILGIGRAAGSVDRRRLSSEEHTSELPSLMRISYAVFCLNNKTPHTSLYH